MSSKEDKNYRDEFIKMLSSGDLNVPEPVKTIKWIESWDIHSNYRYVGLIDDKYICSCNVEVTYGNIPKLFAIWTLPEERGKGYSKSLLDVVLSDFKDICLEVRIDNPNAINLYSGLGFEDVDMPHEIRDGFSYKMMVRYKD